MWLPSDRCRENVISSIVYQFINPHKLVMFKQECLYGMGRHIYMYIGRVPVCYTYT